MERRIVWFSEDDEYEGSDAYFLGTFSGHLEARDQIGDEFYGLSLDDALAWARERAEEVYLRFDNSGYYSAGTRNDIGHPNWPPDDLPRWERRRPRGEEWKDRHEGDPQIRWVVTVWLNPPLDAVPPDRGPWDAAAAAVTARAGGAEPHEAGVDEMIEAQRKADEHYQRTGEHLGWTGYVPAYEFDVRAEASTREGAVASAIALCQPLPEGWVAGGEAHPDR